MMSVTSWSSSVGWFASHALNRILLTECLNRYDRRPRLHPRPLTLHLSFLQASPLRNTPLGGPPLFHCSRNRFSFARQVGPLPRRTAAQLPSSPSPHGVSVLFCPQHSPPLLSATLSPSSLFQTWQSNAHAAEMARYSYAGRTKQHDEGRSGMHLLVRFANRAGGGAIRQVLNRELAHSRSCNSELQRWPTAVHDAGCATQTSSE